MRGTHPALPPATFSTLSRTPLFPSVPTEDDELAGTRAYAVRRLSVFVISFFAFRSNSLRRTGRGANKPCREMVVPRYSGRQGVIQKVLIGVPTGLATLPDWSRTLPSLASLRTAPMGAISCVAVTMVTDSHSAHNAERASPRNPKVVTWGRSSSDGSLDVWCLRAEVRQHMPWSTGEAGHIPT